MRRSPSPFPSEPRLVTGILNSSHHSRDSPAVVSLFRMAIRVLVVESSDIVRRSTVKTLQREGYDTGSTDDLPSALPLLAAERFDVVLINVSEASRTASPKSMAVLAKSCNVSIVLTSGGATPWSFLDYDGGGHLRYLAKPYSTFDLLTAIHEASVPTER